MRFTRAHMYAQCTWSSWDCCVWCVLYIQMCGGSDHRHDVTLPGTIQYTYIYVHAFCGLATTATLMSRYQSNVILIVQPGTTINILLLLILVLYESQVCTRYTTSHTTTGLVFAASSTDQHWSSCHVYEYTLLLLLLLLLRRVIS